MVYDRGDAVVHGGGWPSDAWTGATKRPSGRTEFSLPPAIAEAFQMDCDGRWEGEWDSTAFRGRQEGVFMTWVGKACLTRVA